MADLFGGLICIPLGIWLMIVAGILCVRPVPFLGWLTLKGRSGFQWFLRAVYLLPILGMFGVGLILAGSTLMHENLPDPWKPFVAISGFLLGISTYLIEKKTTIFSAIPSGYKFAIYPGLAMAFVFSVGGPPEGAEKGHSRVPECRFDNACWGEKHLTAAHVRCDTHIERLATHDYEWTTGFGEMIFSRWAIITPGNKLVGPELRGSIIYIGDKIRFQNGFGVFSTYTYHCYYKPDTKTVLKVEAKIGRLSKQ